MTSQDFYMQMLNDCDTTTPAAESTAAPAAADTIAQVEALIAELKASRADITSDYTQWLKVGFSLVSQFGESGRTYFHGISSLNPDYNYTECDKKYDECLKSDKGRTNISTLFYLAEQQGIRIHKPKRNPALKNAHTPHTRQATKMSPCRLPNPKEKKNPCRCLMKLSIAACLKSSDKLPVPCTYPRRKTSSSLAP